MAWREIESNVADSTIAHQRIATKRKNLGINGEYWPFADIKIVHGMHQEVATLITSPFIYCTLYFFNTLYLRAEGIIFFIKIDEYILFTLYFMNVSTNLPNADKLEQT